MKVTFKKPPSLSTLLTFRRPAKGRTEELFIKNFIDSVPGMQRDTFGNRYIRIGDSNVMFSCHTDSVHRTDGFQRIAIDNVLGHYILNDDTSNCLGADDATGIYIALQLIYMQRPGLYVFHREEESGGHGSMFFRHNKALYEGIKQCIALDRKDVTSVITYQGGRCCSDKYGDALAKALGMGYKRDETGVFTDSANYVKDIPECTNLSVGYWRQHSKDEHQCIYFPNKLVGVLKEADLENLPIVRDPKVYEARGYQRHGGYDGRSSAYQSQYGSQYGGVYYGSGDYKPADYDDLFNWAFQNPDAAAWALHKFRCNPKEMRDAENKATNAYFGYGAAPVI